MVSHTAAVLGVSPNLHGLFRGLVLHRGFEPLSTGLKTQCPRPLDECSVLSWAVARACSATIKLLSRHPMVRAGPPNTHKSLSSTQTLPT